jgi:hypothetical protein
VHLTFAEFLTAQKFIQMLFGQLPIEDMGMDEVRRFVRKFFKEGVSQQTMRFVEGFCDKYKDQKIHIGVLSNIKGIKKNVFYRICRNGMLNLYSLLFGEVFDGALVGNWLSNSQKATVNVLGSIFSSKKKISLFFYACCSSPQLAELLSKSCPKLQVDDVDKLIGDMAKLTSPSRQLIEIALSRVEDWKSRWPSATFFDKYLDSGFPTELYEFALKNCPDIDKSTEEKVIQMLMAPCSVGSCWGRLDAPPKGFSTALSP